MRTRIEKKNANRLMSLSAVGAGVLAAGASSAHAGVITTSVNLTVGFGGGSLASLPGGLGLPGTAELNLLRLDAGSSSWWVNATAAGYARVGTTRSGLLPGFAAGNQWNSGASMSAAVAALQGASPITDFDATRKYFLFLFQDSTQGDALRYGWGELSIAFSPTLDVTLVQWAYDDTGAKLAAGDTVGTSSVPEPGALALTGLGALALGARGIRRWRADRQA